MNGNIISISLKSTNALKKVRGFQKVEKAGVETWVKTTNNKETGVTRHLILPSGTNVIYGEELDLITKKVITKNGLFSKSFFEKDLEKNGSGRLRFTTLVNLKDYTAQVFCKHNTTPELSERYQFRNNLFGNLNLFNYIFKK